jgi:hypothetical protein
LVLTQKFCKHAVLVVSGKVDVFDVNAHHIGHGGGINKVDVGRAKLAVVVIFPIFHENADHLVALLFQQMGRDGGVDAARQTHNNSVMLHKPNYPLI